jgi:hypothetical protein
MVAFVCSFPPDPEADLKNFQQQQAEYEAAYYRTGEPFVLYEALLHAGAAEQLTPDWLVTAVGNAISKSRTDEGARRFRARMLHVQRYRCVRDLRQKRPNKDGVLECLTKDQALKLATAKLKAATRTIEDSYDRVNRDLKKKGRESEFFWLVARSDPTVVPVSVTRRSDGVIVINGVAQQSRGSITSPTITRARSLAQRSRGA